MSEPLISAEIEPRSGQATRAAQALQRLGFRVLHIGPTISVQAAQRLWESTFSVSFQQERKRTSREIDGEISFPQPKTDAIQVPMALQDLMVSVAFVEPPEWFGGSS